MSRHLLVPLFPDGVFGSDYYSSTAESVLWHASPLQSATRLPHWLWLGKCKFGVAVNFLTWTELKWIYLKGGRVVQKVILRLYSPVIWTKQTKDTHLCSALSGAYEFHLHCLWTLVWKGGHMHMQCFIWGGDLVSHFFQRAIGCNGCRTENQHKEYTAYKVSFG